jgi:hypothetical protein
MFRIDRSDVDVAVGTDAYITARDADSYQMGAKMAYVIPQSHKYRAY